jgi:hypothetical protein
VTARTLSTLHTRARCANLIALKLPQLSVTALMKTPGCTYFQPHGRDPMRRWLAQPGFWLA